jgi:glycerophosphoryl diester phosphodiesterase
MPAISAHRGGSEHAAPGTYGAYQAALAAGADYVELDVRRTVDGVLVSSHRERLRPAGPVAAIRYDRLCQLARYQVPRLDESLRLLAGRAAAHLDLKEATCAAAAVDEALGVLRPAQILVTTRDEAAAAAVLASFPGVPVGVTVGGDLPEALRFAGRRVREPRLSPLAPVLRAGAGWAVLHHRTARSSILAECRGRGLAVMVWTVNGDRALARFLATPGVSAVVTDRPARAVGVRAAGGQGRPAAARQG